MANHHLHLTEIDPSTLIADQKAHAMQLPSKERYKEKDGSYTVDLTESQWDKILKDASGYMKNAGLVTVEPRPAMHYYGLQDMNQVIR